MHGGEQVPVGDEAQSLIPRFISGGEVFGGVELLGQPGRRKLDDSRRIAAGLRREKAVEVHLQENILPADDTTARLHRKPFKPFIERLFGAVSDE